MPDQTKWLYECGEGRFKHYWKKDAAGFVPSKKGPVGKCHSSISDKVATQLLHNGVTYQALGTTDVEHVYAVYRGVIYEAAPTQVGISFHDYPWRGDLGGGDLPPRVLRKLAAMAKEQRCFEEYEQWLEEFSA